VSRIFISYRRSDASGHAGRLRDRLHAHFGEDIVFQDVDNIPDGEEFAKVIERALDSCSVAVVVIGRNWVNAESAQGVRRFDDPDDWVRAEVGLLLRRGIRVVPVLVQGASMPLRKDLPEDLKNLAGRNARELRDSAWDADVSLLLQSLEPAVGSPLQTRRKWRRLIAAGVAALAIGALLYAGLSIQIGVGEFQVPDFEGKPLETAREILAKGGMKNVNEQTLPSTEFGPGRVLRTDPPVGKLILPETRITVFVSSGTPPKTVPPPAAASVAEPGTGAAPLSASAPSSPRPSTSPVAAGRGVAGTWNITQHGPDGTLSEGVMRVGVVTVENELPRLTGQVRWNNAPPGQIVYSELRPDSITFKLRYADGLEWLYTAELDASRAAMTRGHAVPIRGAEATWTATRAR
jgi:hypothetical protein